MRGKLFLGVVSVAEPGITPADAGKTCPTGNAPTVLWDHPRGCGENCSLNGISLATGGSPPRMRGKRCAGMQDKAQHGITPADAGKTDWVFDTNEMKWDHPRGCGENLGRGGKAQCPAGSPPRMRGKPCFGIGGNFSSRITPADAGKTSAAAFCHMRA